MVGERRLGANRVGAGLVAMSYTQNECEFQCVTLYSKKGDKIRPLMSHRILLQTKRLWSCITCPFALVHTQIKSTSTLGPCLLAPPTRRSVFRCNHDLEKVTI